MSADIFDIVDVVDRRATAIERKITALCKQQSVRRLAIEKLELACELWARRMREMDLAGSGATTAVCLQEMSQDGREYERTLQDLRTQLSGLRTDEARARLQRKAYCDTLLGLRRKAEYMRDRQAQQLRKEARRQFAREIAGVTAVALE